MVWREKVKTVMGIIAEILGGAAGFGGITGLVGGLANRFFAYREKEQAHKHALDIAALKKESDAQLYDHEKSLHELNLKTLQKETEREILVKREAGSWEALKVSQEQNGAPVKGSKESQFVTDTKGLTRPALTLLLWASVVLIFFFVDPASRDVIMSGAIYCATAATLWWFADRAPSYKELTMRGKGGA